MAVWCQSKRNRSWVRTASLLWFFFFQAEDGIRDLTVTGVQTCALPIWDLHRDRHLGGGRQLHGGDPDPDHHGPEDRADRDVHGGPGECRLPELVHRGEYDEQLGYTGLHLGRRLLERRHDVYHGERDGQLHVDGHLDRGRQLHGGDPEPDHHGREDRPNGHLQRGAPDRHLPQRVYRGEQHQQLGQPRLHLERCLLEPRHDV